MRENTCKVCEKKFKSKRPAKTCSNKCRRYLGYGLRQCPSCNTEFYPTNAKGIYCSKPCRMEHKFGIPKDIPNGYKWCSGGRHVVSIDEFGKKGSGLQPLCKDCQSVSMKKWYTGNKEEHKKNVAKNNVRYRSENREKIYDILVTSGCADCSDNDIRFLEFDHREGENKRANISEMLNSSWPTIQKEIDKCDVVCVKCHKLRTYARLDKCWRIEYYEKHNKN